MPSAWSFGRFKANIFRRRPTTVQRNCWSGLNCRSDDAPALVVSGFNEGRVPASLNSDVFLPNQLRRALGIEDNDRRYARDAYALSVLAASREELRLIAGRRSGEGEPMLPSRLLFTCDEPAMANRVVTFFDDEKKARLSADQGRGRGRAANGRCSECRGRCPW